MTEAVQSCHVGLLLNVQPQFVPEGLPEEAVDEGVQAAVGESCKVDNVAG